MRWILDNVPGARARAEAGELLFGTIDSWLIWNLTGGLHLTDATNASRTLLMDLRTLAWEPSLADAIGVPLAMLPTIRSSSEVYGEVRSGALAGVPIAGDLGDQHAAMFGQTCFAAGEAKNTYGTGNFMLINTGQEPVRSRSGLLSTVCYRLGGQRPVYALEGSIAVTGSLVQWLRDNLGLIASTAEVEELACSVKDSGGVYIVPAFSGLFAPYWRADARGVIVGLTRYVNRGHIARAALEATALPDRRDRGGDASRLRRGAGGAEGRRRHGRRPDADAVPGRHPRGPGRAPSGGGDHRARRGLRRGAGDRLLDRARRAAVELGRGRALAATDGRHHALGPHAPVEEGCDADLRLGRLGGRAVCAAAVAVVVAGDSREPQLGASITVRCCADNRVAMTLATEVLIIGGGATGAGAAWDAALRGLDVVLVERGDLATGTSGRFHGLLHSGGRYVVKDPVAARECIAENRILKRVAAACVEDTGGLFVTTPWDNPAYAERFVQACGETGVDCEEIPVAQALREEPRLNPRISRAFRVPDANLEVWELVGALAQGASRRGARILTHHEVTGVRRDGDRVTGAVVRDLHGGREIEIEAAVTVNAAGAWCDRVAALAGIEGVRILPGRGIMIAANHRLVNTVINRCELPGDGDILVPIQTVSVIGTTDQRVASADDLTVAAEEVEQMLDDGEKLVPGFRRARMLRVWAGVRRCSRTRKRARWSEPAWAPMPGPAGPAGPAGAASRRPAAT